MNSSYQILPSTIEGQLAYIKKNIYLHKNGIVSESMEDKGIHYAMNYGVSLLDLKQLVDTLPHNELLAQRLWDENIRETKLLATLLYPAESMNEEKAITWLKDINNIELAEQVARNLLSKSSIAISIANNWCQSTNNWQCSIGFMTAAYCMTLLPLDVRFFIDQKAYTTPQQEAYETNHKNQSYEIYWSIALYLKKRGASDPVSANEVLEHIKPLKGSRFISQRYIYEEVFTYLCYRFDE